MSGQHTPENPRCLACVQEDPEIAVRLLAAAEYLLENIRQAGLVEALRFAMRELDKAIAGWMDKSIYISAHDGRTIAKIYGGDAKDTALLFIRAVNSHEALLEAAKLAYEIIPDIDSQKKAGDVYRALYKAIAQAEGKV